MHVKSKQLCEYPLDQKERLGLLATAVSLRDLCWMVQLSPFLCVFHAFAFPTHLQDPSFPFILSGSPYYQHLGCDLESPWGESSI